MAAEDRSVPDQRRAEEIRRQIRELAASYVPEWKFSEENPDIGSIIAMIYAKQTEETIRLFDGSFSRFRTMFADLMGMALRPARAAQSIVVMKARDRSGAVVGKATKLTARAKEGEPLIFETMQDLFVSGVSLTDIVGISCGHASIRSYLGEMKAWAPFPVTEGQGPEEEGREIWKQELVIYHGDLFDRAGMQAGIRFSGEKSARELASLFSDERRYRFLYDSGTGLREIEQVRREGDRIILRTEGTFGRLPFYGEKTGAVILHQLMPGDGISIKSVELFGDAGRRKAEYVSDEMFEQDVDCFRPFGEELALYRECYIGQDEVFSRKGALIELEFVLSFEEKCFALRREEEEKPLPLIRKIPRYRADERPWMCAAEEVGFAYFNGTGWKRLHTEGNPELLFGAREQAGKQRFSFYAPHDWQALQMDGYQGRCLRLWILKSDHCYMRPAVHFIPVIRNLQICYSYEGQTVKPDGLFRVCGARYEDLLPLLQNGISHPVFLPFPYPGNALYLGFDRVWRQGPVSLYIKLRREENGREGRILWEYSTGRGFQELWVRDGTGNLSHSGIVMFEPPSDMGLTELEGVKRCWLRLRDENGSREEISRFREFIEEILPNAVMAHNVETAAAEDYYLDTARPDMEFPLYGDNLLEAEVWVNEKRRLAPREMEEMLKNRPDTVQAEYDSRGEISAFYVKWEEADHFLEAEGGERLYQVDRINNRLLFGDGIRVRIPGETADTAFRVIRKSCRGSLGNVEPGSIDGFYGNVQSVREVKNPAAGFGGSDLERTQRALWRSSHLIGSRRRLVSEYDYEREALGFSEDVAQAACICGVDRQGRVQERQIHLVVLMRDYRDGMHSFYRLRRELKTVLDRQCEAGCREGELCIEAPDFVEVSVKLWLQIPDIREGISVRRRYLEQIEAYLEPGSGPGEGRQIGEFPTEEQIGMMLHGIGQDGYVERYAVTAARRDEKGLHEMPFEKAAGNPFAVCCNGAHQIYVRGG